MNSILDCIGNTPLVRLSKISPREDIEIYGKVEYVNPSLSVKDRIAIHIIKEAERTGKLKPGGTIVENTSGNTGAAIAMIGAIKGYKVILTMPDKVSTEKQNTLKAFGAEVIIKPTDADPESEDHYIKAAEILAKNIPGSFRLDQYNNPKNAEAHYLTTGPEIWEQCKGKIDVFVAAASTGGTISGAGRYLKEKNPALKVVMPDPVGSIFYDYLKTGKIPKDAACTYQVEGIGEDHLVKAIDFSIIDNALQVTDEQAFSWCRKLAREEGLLCGGSSGANVFGAIEIAKQMKGPATIVTILCDSGVKYLSKIFNL